MRIDIPELERLPAEQQKSLLEATVRSVNATHGRMSNVPHYVGCAITIAVVLPLAIAGYGMVVSILAGAPLYFGALIIGFILWRRSMVVEARKVIRRSITDRTGG